MQKHKSETMTLGQIIDRINPMSCDPWYTIVGVKIPGLAEAFERANSDDEDIAEAGFNEVIQIEEDYITAHKKDVYEVSWPEHVTIRKLNSDASYHPQ